MSADKNIWANLLTEVQTQSRQRLPLGKNLLILGDEEVGKTSLIAKLKKDSEITKGYALEYISMDIKDEEREDFTRLGIWIGDSRCYQQNGKVQGGGCPGQFDVLPSLLKYSLSPKNFGDTLILISVTMSKPWNILESISKWLSLVRGHIRGLVTDSTSNNSSVQSPSRQPRTEPTNSGEESIVGDPEVHKLTLKDLENYKENVIKMYLGYSDKEGRTSLGGGLNQTRSSDKSDSASAGIDGPEVDVGFSTISSSYVLPMMLQDENILTENLGLPVIVVVTKTDIIPELEKEYDFRNEHFDFIQQHVRKLCLSYGAGLVYTSCKENKNCDLLRQYVLHLQYGFPFGTGPKIVDNDSIFIPIGWDSTKKIAILNEGLSTLNPDDKFEDVLGKAPIKKEMAKSPDVMAEDEQIFLSRMQMLLSQPVKSKNEMMSNRSPIAVQKNLDRSGRLPSSYQTPAAKLSSSSGTAEAPLSKMVLLNNTMMSSGSSINAASAAAASISAKTPDNVAAGTNSERILTVFFNSLLHKGKSSSGPTNASASSTTSSQLPPRGRSNVNESGFGDDNAVRNEGGADGVFNTNNENVGESFDQTTNHFTSFDDGTQSINAEDGLVENHPSNINGGDKIGNTTPTKNMSLSDLANELDRLSSSTPILNQQPLIPGNVDSPDDSEKNHGDGMEGTDCDPLSFLTPPRLS